MSSTRSSSPSASKRTPPTASTGELGRGLLAGEGLDLVGDLGLLAILEADMEVLDHARLVDDAARRHRQLVEAVELRGLVLLVPDDRELRVVVLGEALDLLLLGVLRLVDGHREDGRVAAELIDQLLVLGERLLAGLAERAPEVEDQHL